MTTHEHTASLRHARTFLRRLERLDAGAGTTITARGLERFDEIWGQVRHAHVWLSTHPGPEADDLCAQYPLTALCYWLARLPAHERQTRMAAACAAATRQHAPGAWGALIHHLGLTYLELGDPGKAAACFDRSLAISTADGAAHAEAQDRESLARAYLALGMPERALHHVRRALALLRDENDRPGEALALRTLGRCLRALNRLEAGHRHALEAAEFFVELGHPDEALATVNESLVDRGVVVPEYLEDAVRTVEAGKAVNQDGRIGSLHELGRIHLRLGRSRDALRLLEQALAAARASGSVGRELIVLGTSAEAALALGDGDRARATAEDRVRLADRAGDAWQRWEALSALGDVYRALGDTDRALEMHRDALRLARETSPYLREVDPRPVTEVAPDEAADFVFGLLAGFNAYRSTLASLGRDHAARGDLEQAIPCWEQATAHAHGSADMAEWLGLLAMAYADTDRHESAIECHERQLEIIRRREDRAAEADVVGEIANVRLKTGRVAEAIALYQSAYVIDLQIGADDDMTAVLTNLAVAEWKDGRPQRARGYGERALALAHEGGDPRIVAVVRTELAPVLQTQPERGAATEPEPVRRAARLMADGLPRTARAVLAAALESGNDQVTACAGLWLGRLALADDVEAARAAWLRVAELGDPVRSPQAAAHLARLCERHGGTAEDWTVLMRTDGYDGAADAAARVGLLLARSERFTEARAALEKAVVLGCTDPARVLVNLGNVLNTLDDRLGAREAFRHAARLGTPPVGAVASLALGRLLLRQGDRPGARAAFERAAAAGDAETSPWAYAVLARMAREDGDLAAAEKAVRAALSSGHRLAAYEASATLGVVRLQQDDMAGARAAFEDAAGSPDPATAAEATANLGALLAAHGQLARAEALWASIPVVDSDPVGSLVTFHRAEAMLRRGDRDGAEDVWRRHFGDRAARVALDLSSQLPPQQTRLALEQALLLNDPAVLPSALSALTALLGPDAAIDRLRRAVDDGDPELAPLAAVSLGQLHAEQGDYDAAVAAWRVAVASGHPEHAPHGMYEIGVSCRRAEDLPAARDWYRRAVAEGPSAIRAHAAVNLGSVLVALDDPEGAEAAFDIAIASDDPEQRGKAWVNLGLLRLTRGDTDGARQAWHRALACGAYEPHETALRYLHALREGRIGAP